MKLLTEHIFSLAESPRYIGDSIVFTDINNAKLYRWRDNALEMIWDKEKITSFVADKSGGMTFATMHGLYYMAADGTYEQVVPDLKINDMCADAEGRVIFGTNYHSREQSYPLGALYSYDRKNGLCELDYGYHLANGIGFSPDNTKMYVCDSSVRTIFEYPYDLKTGTCGKKRILVRFRMDDGMPDGMAIDANGNIWTAQWYGRCVICTSPEGKEVQRISLPAAQVSAVEFVPNGLFITTASEYGRLDIAPHSFSPDEPGIGGGIYHAEINAIGSSHAMSNIGLSK